jgi:glycosyltransferase involved in cell wall biosynthesis
MKIIHISTSNQGGGASRAVTRIHKSLKSVKCNSIIWVNDKKGDDYDVISPKKPIHKLIILIKIFVSKSLVSLLKTSNSILHSPQIFSSSWVKLINESNADLIHLHWFQHEMLSIADISKIKKPIVWTLHDMWPFCGAEHISYDNRWKEGYKKNNRPIDESGFDLNRWVWKRKKKYWKNPVQLIATSRWMEETVSESFLMKNWPVETIPNPLDLNIWKPMDQFQARDCFNLPKNVPLILFGAIAGTSEFHKGYDLLESAIKFISSSSKLKDAHLVVFGQSEPQTASKLKIPIIYLGHLNDDQSLRAAYSSCNLLVVPSRIESFAQTASEAQACGVPVVAFNVTGLKTTVLHKISGYLAKPFEIKDLANGIIWTLNQGNDILQKKARDSALKRFSYQKIGERHKILYNKVLKKIT